MVKGSAVALELGSVLQITNTLHRGLRRAIKQTPQLKSHISEYVNPNQSRSESETAETG